MARAPELSDIIRISSDHESKLYVIDKITPEIMTLRDPLNHLNLITLINDNGHWKVAGSNMEYTIEILDKVLLTDIPDIDVNILRQIDNEVLTVLCRTDEYVTKICRGEKLWMIKMNYEFPEYIALKPMDISWREYYIFVSSKLLPLYYHGDRLGWIPFQIDMINLTLTFITSYINQIESNDIVSIAFIDTVHYPIIIVKYPLLSIETENERYDDITKIVLITDIRFGEKRYPSKTRGRIYTPNFEKDPIRNEQNDEAIIFDEMTSTLGHPPIYGTMKNKDKFLFRLINEVGNFVIIENYRQKKELLNCNELTKLHLSGILLSLQVPAPQVDQSEIDAWIGPRDYTKITSKAWDEYEYDTRWKIIGYTEEQMCDIIKQALEDIGHMI